MSFYMSINVLIILKVLEHSVLMSDKVKCTVNIYVLILVLMPAGQN